MWYSCDMDQVVNSWLFDVKIKQLQFIGVVVNICRYMAVGRIVEVFVDYQEWLAVNYYDVQAIRVRQVFGEVVCFSWVGFFVLVWFVFQEYVVGIDSGVINLYVAVVVRIFRRVRVVDVFFNGMVDVIGVVYSICCVFVSLVRIWMVMACFSLVDFIVGCIDSYLFYVVVYCIVEFNSLISKVQYFFRVGVVYFELFFGCIVFVNVSFVFCEVIWFISYEFCLESRCCIYIEVNCLIVSSNYVIFKVLMALVVLFVYSFCLMWVDFNYLVEVFVFRYFQFIEIFNVRRDQIS